MGIASKVKAGAAFVEIGADSKGLSTGLKGARSSMQKFAKGMQSIGNKLLLAGTAALAPLALSARSFAMTGDKAAKMSVRLGIGAEALTGLQHAAEISGIRVETFNMALQRMVRRVSEAAKGTGEAQAALKEMRIEAKELARLSPDRQFIEITKAMQQFGNQADRVRLAMKLFDSEGVSLVQVMEGGADAVAALQDEAKLLGATFDDKTAKAAAGLTDRMTRFKKSLQGVKNVIGAQIEPSLSRLLDTMTGFAVGFRRLLDANPQLVKGFKELAVTLVSVGAAFTLTGTAALLAFKPIILVVGGVSLALLALLEDLDVVDVGAKKALDKIFNSFTVFGKTLTQWAGGLALDLIGFFDSLFLGIARGINNMQRTFAELENLPDAIRAARLNLRGEAADPELQKNIDFRRAAAENKFQPGGTSGSALLIAELEKKLLENRKLRTDLGLDFGAANKGLPGFLEAVKKFAATVKGLVVDVGPPVSSIRQGGGEGGALPQVSSAGGIHSFFGRQNALEQRGGSTNNLQKQTVTGIKVTNELLNQIKRQIAQQNQEARFA